MHQQWHPYGSAAEPGRELGEPGSGIVGERLNRSVGSAEPLSVDAKVWQIAAVRRSGSRTTGGTWIGLPTMIARLARMIAPTACGGAACPASSTRSQPSASGGTLPSMVPTAKVVDMAGTTRNRLDHGSGIISSLAATAKPLPSSTCKAALRLWRKGFAAASTKAR